MKFENIGVYNIENAIRGMRNPLDSWDKSDSKWEYPHSIRDEGEFVVGEKDKELAMRLIKAGKEHRKFLRQVFVSIDITAPRYWWIEMDTYKINTASNSCSTMHTITKNPITIDMFENETYDDFDEEYWYYAIKHLEKLRQRYNETKDIKYFRMLKEALPEGFLQKRTWTANYEVIRNIYHQRKNHKLSEWQEFCTLLENFPCAEYIITK